jgi:hypothetical protein
MMMMRSERSFLSKRGVFSVFARMPCKTLEERQLAVMSTDYSMVNFHEFLRYTETDFTDV